MDWGLSGSVRIVPESAGWGLLGEINSGWIGLENKGWKSWIFREFLRWPYLVSTAVSCGVVAETGEFEMAANAGAPLRGADA